MLQTTSMSLIYAHYSNSAAVKRFVHTLQSERQSRSLVEFTRQRAESDRLIHGAYIGNNSTLHSCLTVRTHDAFIDPKWGENFVFHALLVNPSLEVTTNLSPDLLKNLHSVLTANTKIVSLSETSEGFVLALRLVGTNAREVYSAADEITDALINLSAIMIRMPMNLDSLQAVLNENDSFERLLKFVCDSKLEARKRTAKPENAYTSLEWVFASFGFFKYFFQNF